MKPSSKNKVCVACDKMSKSLIFVDKYKRMLCIECFNKALQDFRINYISKITAFKKEYYVGK